MLACNPKMVYAIDLSQNQIMCTEFKIVCYKYLEYEECMRLIGVFESDDRIKLYDKVKDKLSDNTRGYFDNNLDIIKRGIIHTGKFENYFHIFGKKVLPKNNSKKAIVFLLKLW